MASEKEQQVVNTADDAPPSMHKTDTVVAPAKELELPADAKEEKVLSVALADALAKDNVKLFSKRQIQMIFFCAFVTLSTCCVLSDFASLARVLTSTHRRLHEWLRWLCHELYQRHEPVPRLLWY